MSTVLDAITTITLEDADGLWPGTICVTGFSAKTPALGVNHSGGSCLETYWFAQVT